MRTAIFKCPKVCSRYKFGEFIEKIKKFIKEIDKKNGYYYTINYTFESDKSEIILKTSKLNYRKSFSQAFDEKEKISFNFIKFISSLDDFLKQTIRPFYELTLSYKANIIFKDRNDVVIFSVIISYNKERNNFGEDFSILDKLSNYDQIYYWSDKEEKVEKIKDLDSYLEYVKIITNLTPRQQKNNAPKPKKIKRKKKKY